jgi:hypothetical protein
VGPAETVVYGLESPPIETSAERASRLYAGFKQTFGANWAEPEVVADPEEVAPSAAAQEGWEHLGMRGQVAKILRKRGHEKKAGRFANCQRFGRPGVCSRYPDEHKYFQRHGCGMQFCSNCTPEERRRLFTKYVEVVHSVLAELKIIPKAWVLARITSTLRSDGSSITPEKVKLFNSAVRSVMKGTVRVVGEDGRYGMLFIDEVGSELSGLRCERAGNGLNLHCHGLYIGPRLDWGKTRDLWVTITTEKFGVSSCGFNITGIRCFSKHPMRAVRFALNCLLKYVSKPPAVSPERLADLICAFHGTRRVHSLGMFYGIRVESDKHEANCPQCQKLGIPSTISFEGRYLSNGSCIPRLGLVSQLEAEGYRELDVVRRELFFSREDASP